MMAKIDLWSLWHNDQLSTLFYARNNNIAYGYLVDGGCHPCHQVFCFDWEEYV